MKAFHSQRLGRRRPLTTDALSEMLPSCLEGTHFAAGLPAALGREPAEECWPGEAQMQPPAGTWPQLCNQKAQVQAWAGPISEGRRGFATPPASISFPARAACPTIVFACSLLLLPQDALVWVIYKTLDVCLTAPEAGKSKIQAQQTSPLPPPGQLHRAEGEPLPPTFSGAVIPFPRAKPSWPPNCLRGPTSSHHHTGEFI